MSNIHQMNGLKNWLSFALSAISVLALPLAGLSMARGDCYGHCRHHRRIRRRANCQGPAPSAVRLIVIAVGFGMSAFSLRVSFCEIGNAYAKLRQAGLTRSHRPDNNTSR